MEIIGGRVALNVLGGAYRDHPALEIFRFHATVGLDTASKNTRPTRPTASTHRPDVLRESDTVLWRKL